MADFVTHLIDSGCRRVELLILRWRQVRLEPGVEALLLEVATTKTRRARMVPLVTKR